MVVPKKEEFKLIKAIVGDKSVYVEWVEREMWNGVNYEIPGNKTFPFIPHQDLVEVRDSLREYLMRSHHHYDMYETAIKYLKGEQKQKVTDAFLDLVQKVEVTSISISGENQLRGAVISGKIESNNKSKAAINSPRIVFSSDKIGYETNVEGQCELLESEIYEYIFNKKRAVKDLFDQKDGDSPKEEKKSPSQPVAEEV